MLLQSYFGPEFFVREKVIDAMRSFFKGQGFHEVETPVLVAHPGTEVFLEPFETVLKYATGEKHEAFLLTNPEYFLKKLLVAGVGNLFQITKCFRNNEGKSSLHNPEFTLMEWYRVGADYTVIMKDCEQLFLWILRQVNGVVGGSDPNSIPKILRYQGKDYDLSVPWERLTVAEAFQKYADINEEVLLSEELLREYAIEKGYSITLANTWEDIFEQ